MTTDTQITSNFWKALKKDRTVMLGIAGVAEGHTRPMTAQFEDDGGPIWFFCAADNELVVNMHCDGRAVATFAAKDHALFAAIHGRLSVDTDAATIDRLWNPFVAAWFEGGCTDPKLRLLRLDADSAQLWLNENSLLAGVKMLFGIDPKADYEDKVATVDL